MNLHRIEARGGKTLFWRALAEAGITKAMLRAWYTDGIARPVAEALQEWFDIPLNWWPIVLEIAHGGFILPKRLPGVQNNRTAMNKKHKLSISRGAGRDPFRDACARKGLTQNDLAKRLGISKGRLSQYRRVEHAEPIPAARAKRIASIIEWPATSESWPGGISE